MSEINKNIIENNFSNSDLDDYVYFSDGSKVKINKAKEFIRDKFESFESNIQKLINENPDLERKEIEKLANISSKLKIDLANNEVNVAGFIEPQSVSGDLLSAHEICDDSLYALDYSKIETQKVAKVEKEKSYDYYENLLKTSYQFIFGNLSLDFLKDYFSKTNLDLDIKNISITGDILNSIKIKIKAGVSKYIYFELHNNTERKFKELDINYVGTSLRYGNFKIQSSSEKYLSQNNNFKFAQSIQLLLKKQFLLLKGIVEEESNYSLVQSLSNAKERLDRAKEILYEFENILEVETKNKLLDIIKESTYDLKNLKQLNENKDFSYLDDKGKGNENRISFKSKITEVKVFVVDNLLKKLDLKDSDLKTNFKNNVDDFSFEFFISGYNQKITLKVLNDNSLTLTVSDIINNNTHKQYQHKEIDLETNILNSFDNLYVYISNNNLISILNSVKVKSEKKHNKKVVDNICLANETLINLQLDLNEKIKKIKSLVKNSFDSLILIENYNKIIFKSIDLLITKLERKLLEDLDLSFEIKTSNFMADLFLSLNSNEIDIMEAELKTNKFIISSINSSLLIKNLFIFKNEFEINSHENLLINKLESKVLKVIDSLIEDNKFGSISRKILLLFESSKISRDKIFLNNIIEVYDNLLKLKFSDLKGG